MYAYTILHFPTHLLCEFDYITVYTIYYYLQYTTTYNNDTAYNILLPTFYYYLQ